MNNGVAEPMDRRSGIEDRRDLARGGRRLKDRRLDAPQTEIFRWGAAVDGAPAAPVGLERLSPSTRSDT
jgi:hypothetical protein